MGRGSARGAAVMAGLAVTLALVLGACTAPVRNSAPSGREGSGSASRSPAGGGSARPRSTTAYKVVAPLLQTRRMRLPLACDVFLLSLPPAGCGGVRVRGDDLAHLPGVKRAAGTWWTGPMLLVGTWNGHVLTLTRPPSPRPSAQRDPAPPANCTGQGSRATHALARMITRQHARFHMISLSPCGRRVWMLVAVADRRLLAYLRRHFGDRVLVTGWLRRA